jgi:hypothetical protein
VRVGEVEQLGFNTSHPQRILVVKHVARQSGASGLAAESKFLVCRCAMSCTLAPWEFGVVAIIHRQAVRH